MTKKTKIIIDCDPGVDDAIALAFAAAHSDDLELLAVTTVSGNQTVDKVTENALRLLDFYGLDVPVARGMEGPIVREPLYAPEVHGETGLGQCVLPDTSRCAVQEHAVLYLRRRLMELPEGEKVTLVPTGPLTNLAVLLKLFPEVKTKIREIVFMGGAVCGGNITVSAEFNMYVDPEAARIVFHAGLPLTMCGLDVTNKCTLKRSQVTKLCQSGNPVAKICGDMAGYVLEHTSNKYRGEISIHDAVPLMYLIYPEIFKGERTILEMDCSEGAARGTTLCGYHWWERGEEETNAFVLKDADGSKFQEYLITALYELGEIAAGRKEGRDS